MEKAANITGSSLDDSSITLLQTEAAELHETALSTLTLLTQLTSEVSRQRAATAATATVLDGITTTAAATTLSGVATQQAATDAAITASYGQIAVAAQWLGQYITRVSTKTNDVSESTDIENASGTAITTHNTEVMANVHNGLQVVNRPYLDISGNVVGRSTIAFNINGVLWTAPVDPNPEGPPKYPRWACLAGQVLGTQDSFAGGGESQPQVQWETCAVAGDAPFKFIWQFRTTGTTTWRDFAEPGISPGTATGHNKIDYLKTVSITTPYHKLGESAWTTMRQSKIVVQPHTRDEHGITTICKVRCLVVNEATVFDDETNLIPASGYIESSYGTLRSKDETDSLVIATALYHHNFLPYQTKTRYVPVLTQYVNTPYRLRAFMGYHSIGCGVAALVPVPWLGKRLAFATWHVVESTAAGQRQWYSGLAEFTLACIGYAFGGKKQFKRAYAYYGKRIARSKRYGNTCDKR